MTKVTALIFCTLCLFGAATQAQEASEILRTIQHEWAVANYTLEGKAQIEAFEAIIERADQHLGAHPGDADMWIWRGINLSTLAGAKGGLGALSLAKEAKKSLEKAIDIDANALSGSAYTSLGTLYHKVPVWPVGFGSDKKAERLLQQAISINPKGIDPNYFYGEFLYDNHQYQAAQKYLTIALEAAPRPDRALADQGRRQEIDALLEKVVKAL